MRRFLSLALLLLLAGCSTPGAFFGPTNGPIYLSRDSDPTSPSSMSIARPATGPARNWKRRACFWTTGGSAGCRATAT